MLPDERFRLPAEEDNPVPDARAAAEPDAEDSSLLLESLLLDPDEPILDAEELIAEAAMFAPEATSIVGMPFAAAEDRLVKATEEPLGIVESVIRISHKCFAMSKKGRQH